MSAGFEDAHSTEFDELTNTCHRPDAGAGGDYKKGGTMRLGKYPCKLSEGSHPPPFTDSDNSERHRHRYEFNNEYRAVFTQRG